MYAFYQIPCQRSVNKVATGQGVSNKPVATSVRPNVFCKKNGRDTKASIWAVNEQIEYIPIGKK